MDDENLEVKSITTFSLGGGCAILTELSLLEGMSLVSMVGTYGTVSADASTADELPKGRSALSGNRCPLLLVGFFVFRDRPMFPKPRCDKCHTVTLSHCHAAAVVKSSKKSKSVVWV